MAGYFNEGVLVEWDDERDLALLDRYKVWICDPKITIHCPMPFDLWMLQQNYDNHGIPYGHDYIAVPECKGITSRLKDGWVYHGMVLTTEEEHKEREQKCRERIAPWIEDFAKEYHNGVNELMEWHNRFKALEVEKLEDWELKDAFQDWLQLYRRSANLHFIWMLAGAVIYNMFEGTCKELLGIDISDPLFNDFMGGFDHKLLETDRELFRLGVKAREMGLESLFRETPSDEKLLHMLESTENGKRWLQGLHKFLNEYGWRTIGNWDAGHPSWVEKPSQTLTPIRRFMSKPTFAVDEARPKLIERRKKAEKEAISRVPDDKMAMFTKLLRAAQWCNIVNEEHVFYNENYSNALARYVTKEIGKRFAKAGIIDDLQDIYYMLPEEIDVRIIAKYSAKKLVEERKKQHAEFRKAQPDDFIGDVTKVVEMIVNSPMARTTIVAPPRVRPELNADLYGAVSTPGVAEGIVSIILTEEDFAKFELGNILVTIETSVAWTPLFSIAKAVVTDRGGILSHAAIVGREYGLPVISGTMEGTKKLKTGMRVKVDGDVGAVYILDK